MLRRRAHCARGRAALRPARRRRPRGGLAPALGVLLVLLVPGAGPSAGADPLARPDPRLAALEAALHDAVNAERVRRGLKPLVRRADLDAVARAHSADMAARGYLSHDTPEGVDPPGRLLAAGVRDFRLAGENVGVTTRRPPNAEILHGWLRSPEHRRNLLAPVFNAAGLGIAAGPGGRLYYTQVYVTLERPPEAEAR